MIPIGNRQDLEAAIAQPPALIFLFVNWAIHAINSQKHVARAVAELNSIPGGPPIPCYIADVSDHEGELGAALGAWLMQEGRSPQLLIGGSGPLFVIQDGHVILSVPAPLCYSVPTLTAALRSALYN